MQEFNVSTSDNENYQKITKYFSQCIALQMQIANLLDGYLCI